MITILFLIEIKIVQLLLQTLKNHESLLMFPFAISMTKLNSLYTVKSNLEKRWNWWLMSEKFSQRRQKMTTKIHRNINYYDNIHDFVNNILDLVINMYSLQTTDRYGCTTSTHSITSSSIVLISNIHNFITHIYLYLIINSYIPNLDKVWFLLKTFP